MGGKGNPAFGRRRTIAQIEKDARAASFFRQGMSYSQICEAMGYKSKATAYNAVKRAIADITKDHFDAKEALHLVLERIHDHRRVLQEVIDHPSYLAGKDGKIVTMYDPQTGQDVPVVDKAPMVRAITELRHHIELEAKLLDLFPAAKTRLEVVTDDVVQKEIDQLAKEIAEAGKGTAVPSE